MTMRVKDEPALAVALLQAIIAVGVSFGLHLSAEQVGAIVTLAAAMSALFVRQRVSPVSRLPETGPEQAPDPTAEPEVAAAEA
jgi:hypothetical protein